MTFEELQYLCDSNQIAMKAITSYFSIAIILLFFGCDPVHNLHLENRSESVIEVIYYPPLDNYNQIEQHITQLKWREKTMNKLSLYPDQLIPIGSVIARYVPDAKDIDLDFLEIRQNEDTIRLIGKRAIFMGIQKVKKLDWRLIVR